MFGKRILERAGVPQSVVDAAYYHHVQFGGGGYPNVEIFGKDIPAEARVVSVVDFFCARTEWRPYRKPECPHTIWQEMQCLKGTWFDAEIVDAFGETEFFQSCVANTPVVRGPL